MSTLSEKNDFIFGAWGDDRLGKKYLQQQFKIIFSCSGSFKMLLTLINSSELERNDGSWDYYEMHEHEPKIDDEI